MAHELRVRFGYWAQQEFQALLARAEDQARRYAAQPLRSRAVYRTDMARGQARRSAYAGAYGKVVPRLSSSVATLSPRDEFMWAQELLPDRAREPHPRQPPPDALGEPPPKPQSGTQHMTCVPEATDVEPNAPRQVVAAGSPIGCDEFVAQHGARRLQEEGPLLAELRDMPSTQVAWHGGGPGCPQHGFSWIGASRIRLGRQMPSPQVV